MFVMLNWHTYIRNTSMNDLLTGKFKGAFNKKKPIRLLWKLRNEDISI